MGVDKKDIRSVIHFDPPPSVEAYLQEAGRAGRDGLPSEAVLIHVPGGRGRLGRELDPLRRERARALLGYAEALEGCRRERLLDLLGSSREGRAPCSGCDRCADSAGASAIEGAAEIAAFARENKRRFTSEEAVDLLVGEEGGEPPVCAHWNSLADWDRLDAARALEAACELGFAREYGRGFWKGRIGPGRAYRTMPSSPSSSEPEAGAAFGGAGLGTGRRGRGRLILGLRS